MLRVNGKLLLDRIVSDQRFALVDLLLVLMSGAVWMLKPALGFWFLLIALLPAVFRLFSSRYPFQKTQLDGLVVIFLITAIIGYWASYDQEAAWRKLWFLVTAVLLYYSLSVQPKENITWISIIFFCIGVGVSMHFMMSYDFVSAPRKLQIVNAIGHWIVDARPKFGWTSIHPNYVAGVAAITTPFILYPLNKIWKKKRENVFFLTLVSIGLAISLFAVFMATSRGIFMAMASMIGVWLLWRFVTLSRINFQIKKEALFPILIIIYLSLIVIVLYVGPANLGGTFSSEYFYGTGSRAELFLRSVYLVKDFPITGGGLGAFPGLYSHYILGIPFFNVPNSHNMFLDVAIEQGVVGGLAFFAIFLAGIWFVARAIVRSYSSELQLFNWLVLLALVIAVMHGMVDNYLYNGTGAMLALFLAGVSVIVNRESHVDVILLKRWDRPAAVVLAFVISIGLITILFTNRILSVWYSDLGAVQMAKVELVDFPKAGWSGSKIVSRLGQADASFHTSLMLDPKNLTANYHLGLLSMLGTKFQIARTYLESAHEQAPHHRGVIKALGYCYVWLGEFDKAQRLFVDVPEAKNELDAYVWWWGTQSRTDLSDMAQKMIIKLDSTSSQQ